MGLFGDNGGDADLKLKVKADTDEAKAKVEQLGMSFTKLTGAFAAGNVAADVMRRSMSVLQNVVTGSIQAWAESERVTAQMNATLTSTKHAAGLSAAQLTNLSAELQKLTTFSDDAIMSAQNLLLTFTNITGGQFEDATRTILDMSTALGTDLKSSAIQLGKALQDPINGVSALQRVGVNFSEAQKEVIEQLVKTGDAVGAQKMILEELRKEFGGSATAAAKTFGGQVEQLRNQIDDLQEEIGRGLTSAITNVISAFKDANSSMSTTADTGKTVFRIFSVIAEAAANTSAGIHAVAGSVVNLGSYVAQTFSMINGIAEGESQFWTDFRASTRENNKVMTDFALNLHDRNEQTMADWENMTADATKYGTAGPAAYQETGKAAQEAADKIKAANDAVRATREQIQELQKAHTLSVGGSRQSIAEAYLDQAKKIEDLRKQLSTAQTYEDKTRLAEEVQREEQALARKRNIGVEYATEITEANRRASLTEFERTLEDIATKQKVEQADFEKKLERLNNELLAEENKRARIAQGERSLTSTITVEAARRTSAIEDSARAQIAQYEKVSIAAAQAMGVKSPLQVMYAPPPDQQNPLSAYVKGNSLIGGVTGSPVQAYAPIAPSVPERSVPSAKSSSTILNINLNGDIAGDEGIRAAIQKAFGEINRQTTLKTYAGQ